ncbi:ABC transporter substrate-binding protein [Phyllobacterium sp. 0TCS1.6C]|uniref:ABC transporter substrate-binding protein n=1 Tax=unclassified Phyllobacterium TaxID=2638441 RepID=UPI0022646349|nr:MULTISPECIES: ABC transporter substrate-binding protein [unclassified Phyllobacterium]MCX8279231.1 ABC transporter substrate-binding protein [Phyllobacterium sp. 0TCS1.6C]MCX8294015.1 ABC transporter substrate-binding protein [Phyllobacterium sp. 0TCS1.6A]
MNINHLGRRHFLSAGLAAAGLSLFSRTHAFAQETSNIRMIWWGGDERARRTNAAIDLFRQTNPDIAINAEFMGWDDYWARIATQVAGSNAPDFIQMDYRYMFEYARRGAIRPLDEYLGKQLKLGDFGQVNLDNCSVDGKLYGGNVGVNAFSVIFNSKAWEEAGVEPPSLKTTWDGFAEKCEAFSKGNQNNRLSATADGSYQESLFEIWLRTQGKALYNPDGTLAYDAADAGRWFAYWAELRKANSCVAADVQALYKQSPETSPIVNGRSATDFAHSNQFEGYQNLLQFELSATGTPIQEGGKPGQYLKPSQLFAISSSSKSPEATARLINFLIAEPEGAKILGLDRGVPASPVIRQAIMSELNSAARKVVELVSNITPLVGPLPPTPPRGAGEINDVLIRISQEASFEAVSPEQAGANLVDEAAAILQRA